jgi:hypothetical protein
MSPQGKRNPDTAFLSRTKIEPEKTAAEIQDILSRRARRVMSEFDGGEVVAISFSMMIDDREILFRLPVRWENFFTVMVRKHQASRKRGWVVDRAQAKRTAWRVAKAWLEAQLALIDSGMVELQEVMLPYIVQAGGQETLYERLSKTGFLLEHKG